MMSRARRMLVGVVAMLSLLGIGGTIPAGSPEPAASISRTVWCC
jgi:hypothetical protein